MLITVVIIANEKIINCGSCDIFFNTESINTNPHSYPLKSEPVETKLYKLI